MIFKGKFVFLVFAFLILTAFAGFSEAKTIYVPDSYEKIQWAVDNAIAGDTIIVRDGTYYENLKVDKQLTIKSENGSANCIIDGGGSGSVITLNANGITIEGFTVRNSGTSWSDAGIKVNSDNNSITGNNISNNWYGIHLWYSSNNSITNNNLSLNNWDGILLYSSSNNLITNNSISLNNGDGILLSSYSSNNSITNNNLSSNNEAGIHLVYSSNNSITGNNISNNYGGIILVYSSNNIIKDNIFTNDGVVISGYELQHWNTHAIENNIVNGRPLYYFKNQVGGKVSGDVGQVILANCTGMTLENLNISNTDGIQIGFSSQNIISNSNISNNGDGIHLWYSSNNSITNNNLSLNNWSGICLAYSSSNSITNNNLSSNNWDGIYLHSSSNNSITDNNISNNWNGIHLAYSSNNKIYLNNFIDNTCQVYSYDSTNTWNSTEMITYIYNGSTYTNYLGNYWSDYTGSDANGDGTGDTPYIIDGDKDEYPLMEHFEHYFAPEEPGIIDVSWSGSTRKDVFNRSDSITFHIVVSECDPEEIDFNVSLENKNLSIRYNLSGTVEYVGNQTFKFESEIPSSAFVGIYDVYVYLYVNSELRDVYVAPEKIYIIFESPTKYQGFVCDRIYPVRISDLYPSLRPLLRALDLLLAYEFEKGYFNITSFNPDSIVWEDTIQDVNGMSEYLSASYIVSDVKSHIDYNYNVTGKPPKIQTIIWNFFFGGKNAGVNTSPTEDCAWWDTDKQIYLSGKGVCNDYSDLYISKVRSLNIPARRVSGLLVKNSTPVFHVWVETYIDNKCYLAEPTWGVFTDDFKCYAKRGYTVILALTKEESETGKTINVADRYRFSEKVILKEDDGNIEILLTNLTDTYYLILAYPTKHEFKRYIIKNKTQEMLTVPKKSLTVYLFSDNGCLIDFASTNDEPKVRNLVKLNTTITIPEYLIGFSNMGLIDEEEIKNMVLREIVIMKKLPYYVKYKMDKDVNLTLIVPENDITYFATKIKTLKTEAQSLNNLNYYRPLCGLNTS